RAADPDDPARVARHDRHAAGPLADRRGSRHDRDPSGRRGWGPQELVERTRRKRLALDRGVLEPTGLSSRSSCAKSPSLRRTPARHRTGVLNSGPAYANEWYSPCSPAGSIPVAATSATKRSSMTRPSHSSPSFVISTHVSTA